MANPMIDTTTDFSSLTLTPQTFPAFYRKLMLLRFPIPVAQVLELRYAVNHAIDGFQEPPHTPDHRQFREALLNAIESFGIDNKHHRERMLKLLTLLRELHVSHSLSSRDNEERVREQLSRNTLARSQSVRLGVLWFLATLASGLMWLLDANVHWLAKIGAFGFGYLAFDYFHSLPALDAQAKGLRRELNDVLRVRVASLNWKTLIHKLSLVLGYKQVTGVEVFRFESETTGPHLYH